MDLTWRPGPSSPDANPGTLDIWSVDLTDPSIDRLHVLSEEERERASSFRYDRHARRFRRSHAAVRHVLARYVDCDPADLAFGRRCGNCGDKGHGKPQISAPLEATGLTFNVSTSGDHAAIAVSGGPPTGVDLEVVDDGVDWQTIAERFLSEEEREHVFDGNRQGTARRFFRAWTRKEAFLKMTGRGLSGRLEDITVPPSEPEEGLSLVEVEGRHYLRADLEPNAAAVATAFTSARECRLHRWTLALGTSSPPAPS